MMKRKGGGSPSSLLSGTNSNSNSNRQYDSNEKLKTILLTSSVWVLILSLALFFAIRFYSSPDCSQTSIIKSISIYFKEKQFKRSAFFLKDAFCGIGQVLTRFCSDSYKYEQTFVSTPRLFFILTFI